MATLSPVMPLYSLTTLAGGLVAASLLWYVASAVASRLRLRHIPGPFLASFSYTWAVNKLARTQIHRTLTELHRQYGPVVRLGPNEVVIHDAEALWRINGVRSPYPRGPWYSTMKMDPYGHNLFSDPNMASHDRRKAQLAGGFAGRGGMNLEHDVDVQLATLVKVIKDKYISTGGTKVLDLGLMVRFFTIDVTSAVGFGESWGDLANERDTYNYLAATDAFAHPSSIISLAPTLRLLFLNPFVLSLIGPKPTDETGFGKVLALTKQAVKDRYSGKPRAERHHDDVVDTWMKNGVNVDECERDINLLIPAGAETTATVIRATLMYIMASPTVYRKLKDELAKGILDGRISDPITNDEAKALPYLQAVINEGLRIVPPAPLGFPKRVPPAGDTILGKFIPGGTDIYVNTYSMMRNKEVFGDDVDVFRPERFLEGSSEKKALLFKHVQLNFGHGRWLCAGKALALIELNKIFVELLRRFDFQILDPQKPWVTKCSISWSINGFLVRATDGSFGGQPDHPTA